MASTKGYQAILQAMLTTPAIYNLVGKYSDGVTPLIVFGVINEAETGTPCISFSRGVKESYNGIKESFFIINCYAEKESTAVNLADQVAELFRQGKGNSDGFSLHTNSKVFNSVTDPIRLDVNVPVEVRINYC